MTSHAYSLPDLDPAVGAALGLGSRRQAIASLPKDQRAKKTKQRAKDRLRHRVNLDLDPDLDRRLRVLADLFDCPISGLVELAIAQLLTRVNAGEIILNDYMIRSNSPRYEHLVNIQITAVKGFP